MGAAFASVHVIERMSPKNHRTMDTSSCPPLAPPFVPSTGSIPGESCVVLSTANKSWDAANPQADRPDTKHKSSSTVPVPWCGI